MRQLVTQVHELELEEALTELYEEFCTWGGKGMSAFDLCEKIHEFHDGISRELYKLYVLNSPEIAVAIGLSRRAIDPSSAKAARLEQLFPGGLKKE